MSDQCCLILTWQEILSVTELTLFLCEESILLRHLSADAYSQTYVFFSLANVTRFLSVNQVKITSFSNCISACMHDLLLP